MSPAGPEAAKAALPNSCWPALESEVGYIATAQALDAEMEDRIAKHRRQRPESWRTFEAPTAFGESLPRTAASPPCCLIA